MEVVTINISVITIFITTNEGHCGGLGMVHGCMVVRSGALCRKLVNHLRNAILVLHININDYMLC